MRRVKNLLDGNQSLLAAKEILDEMGISFFLIHGSLLGIVRHGILLPHDSCGGTSGDIDLASFDEMPDYMFGEFTRVVQKHGLKMFKIEGKEGKGCRVAAAYIRGTPWPIGIEFWKKIGDNKILTYDGLLVYPNFFKTFKKVKYLGEEFQIPGDSEGFLELNYGESWRIPCTHVEKDGERFWARCDMNGNIIEPLEHMGNIPGYAKLMNFRKL